MENKKSPLEETLLYMSMMTFLGGFINSYTFFERGKSFVSMHTGNMAKMGLSLYLQDHAMFVAAIVPICGTVLGGVFYQILKNKTKGRNPLDLKKISLLAELVMLTVVSFIPASVPNNLVNLSLSFTTGFQLSTFRTYAGAAHNTTICTGNLRTFGQKIGDFLCFHNKETALKLVQYFCVAFSFPFGAFAGGFACQLLHVHALILGAVILAIQYFRLVSDAKKNA